MRCIGTEGLDISQLADPSSPSSPLQDHLDLHDVTLTSPLADVTNPTRHASDSVMADLKSPTNSSPSSPQLSPVSTKSDSDLAPRDHAGLTDLSAMSPFSPTFTRAQQFSSISSPELNTVAENGSKRSSSGSSLCVNGDSESESSRTSTAKNTLSSRSSSSTLSEDTSSRIQLTSSAEMLSSSEGRFFGRKTADLRGGRSVERSVQNAGKVCEDPQTSIQLPERYRRALRTGGSYSGAGGSGGSSSGGRGVGSEDLTSREKDLGTALAWIRHEMVQMKEQDKVLLKRFIDLRASILQLRCMYNSTSDVSSMDGSTVSLNELRKPSRMRNADSDMTLAGRIYTATSSLSLPCSPQLSRLRWGSDDLM